MKQARWLLTLGDLLTLLLCFALATMSLSVPSQKGITARKQSEILPSLESQQSPGTLLAPDQNGARVKGSPLTLPLAVSDFESASSMLTVGAWERIKSRAELGTYRFRSADIESCGEGVGAQAWQGAVEGALELRRQLVDIGVPSRAIRVRTRGPACNSDVVMNLVFNRE